MPTKKKATPVITEYHLTTEEKALVDEYYHYLEQADIVSQRLEATLQTIARQQKLVGGLEFDRATYTLTAKQEE